MEMRSRSISIQKRQISSTADRKPSERPRQSGYGNPQVWQIVSLGYLLESFLVNKAVRYDIKGKKYINTLSKYYFSDIGLRNAILNMRQQEESHIMENIIYNELITRGYNVDVGMVEIKKQDKDGKWIRVQLEVDFIANLGSKKYYVQSALSIPDREKEIQESRSLTNINDSFKKVIVVKEHIMPRRNEDGILTIGLFDFLLKEDSLDM